jgi:hypothetical protein
MVLQGDEAQLEARFVPFGNSANLKWKSCWTHPMELLGEWVMWNLVLVHLVIVLVSMQFRCTICGECTIGSEIILDASDDLLGDEAQVEASLSPFGDSANLDAR